MFNRNILQIILAEFLLDASQTRRGRSPAAEELPYAVTFGVSTMAACATKEMRRHTAGKSPYAVRVLH